MPTMRMTWPGSGRAVIGATGLALLLAGCGGSDSSNCDPIAAALVDRIVVAPAASTLATGGTQQLTATAYSCSDAVLAMPSPIWSSADPAIAAVNTAGLVQGVSAGGPINVSVTASGKTGIAKVTVAPISVASVQVQPPTATIAVGRTSTLIAHAFDAQGHELTGRTATWSSSDNTIATVSAAGAVTGVAVGGPITVTATIEGQAGNSAVTVTAAAVNSVTVAPPAADVQAGTTLQLTATLKDDQGNVLTGRPVLWTTSDATHASVSTTGLVTGVAAGGPVTILATSEGRSGNSIITVTPGSATKLGFSVQPTSVAAGAAIAPAVQVQVQDPAGNLVAGSTASVTIALGATPAGATLGGTLTVAAVNGVATFSNLTINRAQAGYTLVASATNLTSAISSAFDVSPGAAARLAFSVQPSAVAAGADITPAVQVEVRDAQGNLVTGSTASITLALQANPGSGTLSGALTVNAVNGIATFSGLSIDKSAPGYTLRATSAGLTGATSTTFTVNSGAAATQVFLVQPTDVRAGSSISPAVQVQLRDAQGNVATTASGSVTLSIDNNPGGATLGGTATVALVNGVATFSNLTVDHLGTGYTLRSNAPGVPDVSSSAFTVIPGADAKLVFIGQPSTTIAGQAITPPVQVQVQDAFGNVATGSTAMITIALASNPAGGNLGGTLTVAVSGGVATFSDLTIDRSGDGYTLAADAAGLPESAPSGDFTVTPGPASKIGFLTQPPASVPEGTPISPAPQVEIQDAHGNRVTTAGAIISVQLRAMDGMGPPPGGPATMLLGTTVMTTAAGVATFDNLVVSANKARSLTLRATASTMPQLQVVSTVFSVTPN